LLWFVDFFREKTFDFNGNVALFGSDSCLLEGIEQQSGAGLARVFLLLLLSLSTGHYKVLKFIVRE